MKTSDLAKIAKAREILEKSTDSLLRERIKGKDIALDAGVPLADFLFCLSIAKSVKVGD